MKFKVEKKSEYLENVEKNNKDLKSMSAIARIINRDISNIINVLGGKRGCSERVARLLSGLIGAEVSDYFEY